MGTRVNSVQDESESKFSSSSSRSELRNDLETQPNDNDDSQRTIDANYILCLNDPDDDGKSTTTVSSDLMTTLRRIEDHVELLTRATVPVDEVNNLKPPRVVSLREDMDLTEEELLAELPRLRQELLDVYSAYTRVTAALSGAEAQCNTILGEVNDLKLQVHTDFNFRDHQ